MAIRQIQSNFTTGIIAPTLKGRIDLQQYYNAVAEAENVVINPHGGLKRRGGLLKIADTTEIGKLFAFEFSTTESYLLHIHASSIKVYKDDSLVHTISSLPVTFTQVQLDEMDIVQSADTMIIVHEDFSPIEVKRQGSDTSWATTSITLDKIPLFDFNSGNIGYRDYFTADGTQKDFYLISTTKPFVVEIDGVIKTRTSDFTWDEDTKSISMTPTPTSGQIVTITSGEGTIEDTSYPFESVWSATKGYPKTATFHQNRLWFGGSKSRINTVWGSVLNNYYCFDIGNGEADDAISDTLSADQYNGITNIVSSQKLTVLTNGGEWINNTDVLTPENSAWSRQTSYGAIRLSPVVLDGSVYYIDRFKKNLRAIQYSFDQDTYKSTPISILSSHLLSGVSDISVKTGGETDISNLIFAINSSGSTIVYNTLRDQNISGFTKWTTAGIMKKVCVVLDDIYFIVTRDEGTYIEKIDNSLYLDHAITSTSTDTIAIDLELQNADAIQIVADGSLQQNTVATGTNAVCDRIGDSVYTGLKYAVKIKTLPFALNTNFDGNIANTKKRISRVMLNVYNTKGLYIDGSFVPTRRFDISSFNEDSPSVTGVIDSYRLGYNRISQIEITQEEPTPMELLEADLEVVV